MLLFVEYKQENWLLLRFPGLFYFTACFLLCHKRSVNKKIKHAIYHLFILWIIFQISNEGNWIIRNWIFLKLTALLIIAENFHLSCTCKMQSLPSRNCFCWAKTYYDLFQYSFLRLNWSNIQNKMWRPVQAGKENKQDRQNPDWSIIHTHTHTKLQNVNYSYCMIRCLHMTLVEVARLAREQTQMDTKPTIRDNINTNYFLWFHKSKAWSHNKDNSQTI